MTQTGTTGPPMRTRFAPSPTGPLHLGHVYSALQAYELAQKHGGVFLLRIEDIDQSRSRNTWEDQIYDDLTWLGLKWPTPVLRQSDNMKKYQEALDKLWEKGVLYRCDCSRKDIAAASNAPQEGMPQFGPDGLIYPGTCRHKHPRSGTRPPQTALRLDMQAALNLDLSDLNYVEHADGQRTVQVQKHELLTCVGDVALSRKNMGTSYHLSVVVDDARQGITHVVRGADLTDATQIHVVLQRLLELPTPHYFHHPLIRDENGKRLAKRDDARAISTYRDAGLSVEEISKIARP